MSRIFCTKNGFPFMVEQGDLPRTDGNKSTMRIFEIAAAFEQLGIEGIHVQCIPVEGGRFIHALNLLAGSFGDRLLKFIIDLMITRKTLYSVGVALEIADAIQKREANHE